MRSKAYLIGIAGGTASGKTTFCGRLEQGLLSSGRRVKVLHLDDYFKPEAQRPQSRAPITGTLYVDDNHPETMELARFRAETFAACAQQEWDVVIAEGLLTLWDDQLYEKLDFSLYVDCRADERVVRRLRRNMEWGLSFDQVAGVYLDLVRYRHDEFVEPTKWRADLILNGSRMTENAVEAVIALVANNSK